MDSKQSVSRIKYQIILIPYWKIGFILCFLNTEYSVHKLADNAI